ncbi:MAG: GDP-mannose 4,6-dehydratase [Nitrospinae bacterium]|nr:GDP-mannose 4,6-dehydratase [Nitrospinota bacterium]
MNISLSDMKNKKVLITGGLGFIGSNLAHKCVELGAQVTIFDYLDPRSGGNIYNVHGIREKIELAFHDILNFDQVSEFITGKDIIFNCASSTSHSFSMREPWIDLDVNSKGVINLLEAVRRFNPDVKFVQLGTSTQLGKLHYEPSDEYHPEFPRDIYSANKSVSEKYVLIYCQAHEIRGTVIRLSNVFGPRASIHSPEFTFNNYFVGLALQNKAITVFGEGDQKRNVTYIDDVTNALIIASLEESTNGEVLFAVSEKHVSVAEIAQLTVKHIGSGSVTFVEWPHGRKNIDIGDAIISNQKIKNLLNWSPRINLADGLGLTREYYKPCLDKYFP